MSFLNCSNLRWEDYFLASGGDFEEFWAHHLKQEQSKVLYIMGKGFDPRMCSCIKRIFKTDKTRCDCLLIDLDEGVDSPSKRYVDRVKQNEKELNHILNGRGKIINELVKMWTDDGLRRRRVGSSNVAKLLRNFSQFEGYSDIIIDISAMPRAIYFPLIGKALFLIDDATKKNIKHIPNLHVVVSEDVGLDKKIREVGIDDKASYIYGFASDLETEATEGIPKVWIPILGEGHKTKLEKLYTLVNPDEICPVLPSPSINPRRGDDILIEYIELLFDQWRVDPRNIIYAAEWNPFETYRQIHRAANHYCQALKPLGGCKVAVSATSSKLLSIGALLAVYELKGLSMSIGLSHVEAQGYEFENTKVEEVRPQEELFTLWLAGGCYKHDF